MQLASKILMPVSMSILGISLAGSVCGELKLETLAQAEKDGYMDTGSYNDRIRGASCNAELYHCAVR